MHYTKLQIIFLALALGGSSLPTSNSPISHVGFVDLREPVEGRSKEFEAAPAVKKGTNWDGVTSNDKRDADASLGNEFNTARDEVPDVNNQTPAFDKREADIAHIGDGQRAVARDDDFGGGSEWGKRVADESEANGDFEWGRSIEGKRELLLPGNWIRSFQWKRDQDREQEWGRSVEGKRDSPLPEGDFEWGRREVPQPDGPNGENDWGSRDSPQPEEDSELGNKWGRSIWGGEVLPPRDGEDRGGST